MDQDEQRALGVSVAEQLQAADVRGERVVIIQVNWIG